MLLLRRAFRRGIGVLIVCSAVSSFQAFKRSSFGADFRKCNGICAPPLGIHVCDLVAYAASDLTESWPNNQVSVSINIDGTSEPEEIVLRSASDCYAEAHRIAEKYYEDDQEMVAEIQTGLLEQWESNARSSVLIEDGPLDDVPTSEGLVLDMTFDGGTEQVQMYSKDDVYSEAWRLAEAHFDSDSVVYEDLLAQLMSKWTSWLADGVGDQASASEDLAEADSVAELQEHSKSSDSASIAESQANAHDGGFSIDMHFEGGVTEQVVLRCEDDIYTEAERIVKKHFEYSQEVLDMVQTELAQQWLNWLAGQNEVSRE